MDGEQTAIPDYLYTRSHPGGGQLWNSRIEERKIGSPLAGQYVFRCGCRFSSGILFPSEGR